MTGDEILFDFTLEADNDDIRFLKELVKLLKLLSRMKKKKEKKILMKADINKFIKDKKIFMKEINKKEKEQKIC